MSDLAVVEIPPEVLQEGKKILIGLPWYRAACPLTTFALMGIMDRKRFAVSLSFGDAFIAHARNKLATQLVNSNLEWIWMVDDDMIFPFGDATWFNETTKMKLPEKFAGFHAVDRLLSHGKTIVGATYFGRQPGGFPVFGEGKKMRDLVLARGPIDQIQPTRWVGTGCVLIHRTVFTDIENQFPHLSRSENGGVGQWFTSSEHNLHRAVEESLNMLADPAVNIQNVQKVLDEGWKKSLAYSRMGVGEDVQLCHRATQSGHQPFVDLGLWCGHVGPAIYPK